MEGWQPFFQPNGHVSIPSTDLLSSIFDKSRYPDDQPVFVDADNPDHCLNKKQCLSLVRKLIAGLQTMPLQKGDCVCVHSLNNIYYPCIVLAVIGAGLIWTGTNPGYTSDELVYNFTKAKVKAVIVEPDLLETLLPAARDAGILNENILTFDHVGSSSKPGSSLKSWKSLLEHGEADWIRFDDQELSCSTTACLMFSSGTTGLPKAAIISHLNMVAQHIMVHEQTLKPYKPSRILCLPFFHAAMLGMAHVTPLTAGQVSYVMRRFLPDKFIMYTEKYQVTEMFMVPPVYKMVLQSPSIQKHSLRSLRWAMAGGASLDLHSQKKFSTLMNRDGCLNPCYGMTELGCLATMFSWPEEDQEGSIGYFLPNLLAKLVDAQGQEVRAYDTRGELCIRGPTVTPGYLDNDKANTESFSQGWFHTGDIAYCDGKTKKWFIVDRKKELIKVRGFQVAPPELEAVLMSHPRILDAAVIGVAASNSIDGEAPRAYVVRKSEPGIADLGEDEVKKYLAARLSKYKMLSGGVAFLDYIPQTASGKHLKRELRELYKRENHSKHRL